MVVIVISMMNCQLSEILSTELTPAPTAYPGIHSQRPLAVTLVSLFLIFAGLRNNSIKFLRGTI
jgi:hypothetical protein